MMTLGPLTEPVRVRAHKVPTEGPLARRVHPHAQQRAHHRDPIAILEGDYSLVVLKFSANHLRFDYHLVCTCRLQLTMLYDPTLDRHFVSAPKTFMSM